MKKKTMSPCFDFVIRFRKRKDIGYTAYVSMYLCMRQFKSVPYKNINVTSAHRYHALAPFRQRCFGLVYIMLQPFCNISRIWCWHEKKDSFCSVKGELMLLKKWTR